MGSYIVLIERKLSFTGKNIPGHREFLEFLKDSGKLIESGAYADQTGGAYVLHASSIEEAHALVSQDPMNDEECEYKVKEWNVSRLIMN